MHNGWTDTVCLYTKEYMLIAHPTAHGKKTKVTNINRHGSQRIYSKLS